ncbi:hypothetical protein PB688_003552 [Vibrio cholerae]|nr:hypothetical protein [Vibrio cholerae]
MASEIKKLERRNKARKKLNELAKDEEHVLVIHYSCESFYDRPEGQTPRVTSIAVRNYASGQTASFSIHKVAELNRVEFAEIDKNYDVLEKEMLHEFYEFMKQHKAYFWVHWNMRDVNYGFPALEHRFRILGGEPYVLDDSKKVDLSRLLVALYTNGYAPHPRIIKLMEMNHITAKDLLDGQGEADAFEHKEFVKLHQSTLRKVDVFCNFLGRTLDGSLITKATWWEMNGGSVKALGEFISKHWGFTLLAGIVGIAAGIYTFF